MKWIQKYAYCALCTVLFGSILLLGIRNEEDNLCFYVNNGVRKEKISLFCDANGKNYVFLPSYADLAEVTIAIPSNHTLMLGGINLLDGMDCSGFSIDEEYELIYNQERLVISFLQSANISTIFLETASGSMENIYADKEHEEASSIVLYTPNGEIEYLDSDCILKGRGNSTWGAIKKPFLVKLSDDASLLGMGEATDWVLLANRYDASNLNNKIAFDLDCF